LAGAAVFSRAMTTMTNGQFCERRQLHDR